MFKFKTSASSVAIAFALAACGGGGGDSSSAPAATTPPIVVPPVVVPPVVIIPADLQTAVPALSYPSGTAEFEFVTSLNSFRQQVGLGLLAQNTVLDKSAGNHLKYVLLNDSVLGGSVNMSTIDVATGRPMFHIEQGDKQGFTGVQEIDRAKFVGYDGTFVGEEVTFGGTKGPLAAFESLTGTIYHRAGLMLQGLKDVGIAVGTDPSKTFILELGYRTPQSNAGDFVSTYPIDGQSGVGRFMRVESPNPFPDLSLTNDDYPTKTGYPVSVGIKEGSTLDVTAFTIAEVGSNTPMDARMMTFTNDPNKILTRNVAYLVAKTALKPNTTYAVSFVGRAYNAPLTKNWKFTTAN